MSAKKLIFKEQLRGGAVIDRFGESLFTSAIHLHRLLHNFVQS